MKTSSCAILIVITIFFILMAFYIFYNLVENKENNFISSQETIRLPEPRYKSNTSVEEAILGRRSVRGYKDDAISLEELSQVLWAAQGITEKQGYKRAAPSAGATYPLELYVVVGKLEGVEPGVFHYSPKENSLKRTIPGDYRKEIGRAASQIWISDAPIVLILTAVYERTTSKYGDRGIRYVHMEAGHAAQNVYLQCQSLNLGTVVVGAFDNNKIKEILNLEKEEPLYIMPVGRV